MTSLSWESIGWYCLFGIFVFYQQLHGRNFRGSSVAFGAALSLSALVGTIVGLVYLGYYAWHVVWWAAPVIFGIGILGALVGVVIERFIGPAAISIAGFVGWPTCAYFMFRSVPLTA